MSPAVAARLRIGVLLLVGVVVQTTLGADLRVDGVAPDLMLLLAISGGLACGGEGGAVVGFCAGLLADLATASTPLGLYALAWCLVGWGVGSLRATALPEGRSVQPMVGLFATAGGLIVFLIAGDLAGQSMLFVTGRDHLLRVGLVESLWNAVLVVPVTFLMRRAARGTPSADRLSRSDALASS